MTVNLAAAALLVLLPVAFNAFFFLLGRHFNYPDILREPTEVVLLRFHAGGAGLRLLWFGFTLTALLLTPLAVVLGQVMARDGLAVAPTATTVGVLASAVQFLGLVRWPFLVPHLARRYADPAASDATHEAIEIAFESFHRYLGVAVGECLGYLLTGGWTLLISIGMLASSDFEPWLGVPGIIIGSLLMLGSWEFVGRNEERGWKLAGSLIPITYVAWSVWLVASGVVLSIA